MAGDWIKWSKGLCDRIEVVRIAGVLELNRLEVAATLMRFWEWCDDNIPDDAIAETGSAFVTLSPRDGDNMAFIDALVGTPKFAEALALVDWIRFRDGRIELPNFGRHNGETAKTRARNAKNQKAKRSNGPSPKPPPTGKSVTEQQQQMSPRDGDIPVTREEKNREECSSYEEHTHAPVERLFSPASVDLDQFELIPLWCQAWDSLPGTSKCNRRMPGDLQKKFPHLWADPGWREIARKAFEVLAEGPLPMPEGRTDLAKMRRFLEKEDYAKDIGDRDYQRRFSAGGSTSLTDGIDAYFDAQGQP